MVKERKSEKELCQMMLEAARKHDECAELEDLFIFGPTPRADANWGFGIAEAAKRCTSFRAMDP